MPVAFGDGHGVGTPGDPGNPKGARWGELKSANGRVTIYNSYLPMEMLDGHVRCALDFPGVPVRAFAGEFANGSQVDK